MRKDKAAAVVAPKVDFAMKFVCGKAAITDADVKAKGESNDCVVRAVMNSFEVSYDTAHEFVASKFGRKPGRGTFGTTFEFTKMANGETVLGKKIVSMGRFSEQPMTPADAKAAGVLLNTKYPKGGGCFAGFTVGKFLAQHPKGSFLIVVAKHALAIRNGKVYDNINEMDKLFIKSGRDQRKCKAIFQIK